MKIILLSIGLLALAFAGLAIKILAKKDGEFPGTCAGNSPFLREKGVTCSVCGANPGEECKNESKEALA